MQASSIFHLRLVGDIFRFLFKFVLSYNRYNIKTNTCVFYQAKSKLNNRASHYATVKAGILGFTKSLAKELGCFRIRVNSVLPFYIETAMTAAISDQVKTELKSKCPLNRFGQPEEVANLVLFLATDASTYMSGSNIDITGGF